MCYASIGLFLSSFSLFFLCVYPSCSHCLLSSIVVYNPLLGEIVQNMVCFCLLKFQINCTWVHLTIVIDRLCDMSLSLKNKQNFIGGNKMQSLKINSHFCCCLCMTFVMSVLQILHIVDYECHDTEEEQHRLPKLSLFRNKLQDR